MSFSSKPIKSNRKNLMKQNNLRKIYFCFDKKTFLIFLRPEDVAAQYKQGGIQANK